MTKKLLISIFVFTTIFLSKPLAAQFGKAEFDNSRGRFGVGGGGALAFKTLGGINGRAYLQFSPYWKIVFSGTNLFKFDSTSQKTVNELYLDLSVLHALMEYGETDVLYIFEGFSASQWNRPKNPKGDFRRYDYINNSKNDTLIFLGGLHVGIGFEKAIGPIAFFTELKITFGAPNWMMATIGLKTNFGRIFKDPNKRYDLNTVDEFAE
ncbi:MAG: hypothetical protein J0M08_08410 [Bacteroidetes bacterium]|nr:hypothetical protein [Bacteroidota bacterium]